MAVSSREKAGQRSTWLVQSLALETHWRASAVLSIASSAAGTKRTRSCSPTALPSPRQADNFFFFFFFSSVGPFGYACAPLYASEHVKQRTLGQEPKGRRSILTSHLVHRLPRKQRTRALTRSNLTVCLIQTRLPDSIAKRECSAGSAEGPRSKIQRSVRPANDTSFRKATTGKTTAWNLPDRRF